MALECLVEVCDVGAMVLVVVNFHGFRVDVGLQSVEWVRQRGHGECHRFFLHGEIGCMTCGDAGGKEASAGLIRSKESGPGDTSGYQKFPAIHEELLSAAGRRREI